VIALVHQYPDGGLAGVWVPGSRGPQCAYRRGASRLRAKGLFLMARNSDRSWAAVCGVLCARSWHHDRWETIRVRGEDTADTVLDYLTATLRADWRIEPYWLIDKDTTNTKETG
jgi:hypothetical protein